MNRLREGAFARGPFRGWTPRDLWAAWEWRWLGTALGVLVVGGFVAWFTLRSPRLDADRCAGLYASARTAGDTAEVDHFVVGGRQSPGMECGAMRRAQRLGKWH
jgi:hypothetical protein